MKIVYLLLFNLLLCMNAWSSSESPIAQLKEAVASIPEDHLVRKYILDNPYRDLPENLTEETIMENQKMISSFEKLSEQLMEQIDILQPILDLFPTHERRDKQKETILEISGVLHDDHLDTDKVYPAYLIGMLLNFAHIPLVLSTCDEELAKESMKLLSNLNDIYFSIVDEDSSKYKLAIALFLSNFDSILQPLQTNLIRIESELQSDENCELYQ